MLTEGWDVKNVFQIVPHEERAFNSKLLIAQVLGRGLRIPEAYRGEWPVVTVYNHDSWSNKIKHLVDEVLEVEKRVASYPAPGKSIDYNFGIHQIDYTRTQEVSTPVPQTTEYEFAKGFVALVSQVPTAQTETTYVRTTTSERRQKRTTLRIKMYKIEEVVRHIHAKFKAIDTEEGTTYSDKYSQDWLRKLMEKSLQRVGETEDRVTDENRQRLQQAFGVVHRGAAQTIRYTMTPKALRTVLTTDRRRDSVGVAALRRSEATIFLDDESLPQSDEETRAVLQAVLDDETLPRSAWQKVDNSYNFKTPLNVVIANHTPERTFIRDLIRPENAKAVRGWIKSTDQDFYTIEYSWRKGEHPKRASFNPDFFLWQGKHVWVIEIKDDEQVREPSEENKAKYKAARRHFETINAQQSDAIYHFHFLAPVDYARFFTFLQKENYDFVSALDVALGESE